MKHGVVFTVAERASKSWSGLDSKTAWMLWNGGGMWRTTSWSRLCQKWLLLQSLATAPMLARHSATTMQCCM